MIILLLLAMMGTLIMSNGVVLRRLRVELQLLEEKQKAGLTARYQDENLPRPASGKDVK